MKTIDTGPKVEDLGVSEETLAAIIVEAHAYNAMVPETDENEASNDIDDNEISALDRDNGDVAHYLAGMPMLGDYLEAGADTLGISLADTEAQTMSHPARRAEISEAS